MDPEPAAHGRIFISFASEDTELADRVVMRLEASGVRCWIAHRDIAPIDSYPAAITAAVTSAAAVVLLLTPASNQSPHVLREVEMAFNARRPILPVRIAGLAPSANLEYFISTTQWFDAGSKFDDQDAALVQARLKQLLAGEEVADEHQASAARRRRIAIVSAAAVAVVLLIAIAVVPWRLPNRTTDDGQTPPASLQQPERRIPTPSPDALAAGKAPVSGAAPSDANAPLTVPASPPPTLKAPMPLKVNPRDGQRYAWIPPGEFVMGCSSGDPSCEEDEKPAHTARIKRGFWLATTEVTESQYRARSADAAARATREANVPATNVDRSEAKAYCAAIGGRLPTEAEWEYAARAGSTTRYYDSPAAVAWYKGNSDERLHPVGTKQPNAFGLYDMLGNVAEWVLDRYYNAYDDSGEDAAVEEPVLPNATGVARGGAWPLDARNIRVSNRMQAETDTANEIIGLRCAVDKF